jgi:hypothetical protein
MVYSISLQINLMDLIQVIRSGKKALIMYFPLVIYCYITLLSHVYTGRKISASLSYVTIRGEGKMEKAREEQDALCAVASPLPVPRLAGCQRVNL